MMNLERVNKIKNGRLEYFGHQLIQTTLQETKEGSFQLPNCFDFNHSWKFQHACSECRKYVYIKEDFDNRKKNFKFISQLNSVKYDASLIQNIADLFFKLVAVELDGHIYLNRNDFEYTCDFQKKTSTSLVSYNCYECGAHYLSHMAIGYPLFPERNIIQGQLGRVVIHEILQVNDSINAINV